MQTRFITLNSIIFLLIRIEIIWRGYTHWTTLNSIMFLLIRSTVVWISAFTSTFKFHYVSINSVLQTTVCRYIRTPLNSIMFLLIPVPKPTAYLLHETPLFCRPLQNISFLSHSSSYVLATPPILAIFYFCQFPTFFTLSQIDRNHYIFIISSFLLAWHFLLWIQSIKYATLIYKSIYKHKILSEQYSKITQEHHPERTQTLYSIYTSTPPS